jgi:hypothetical protein
MTILIRANNNLQTDISTVQSVTEYTTFDLVLLLPSVQTSAVLYSWISPVNTRFAERLMERTPSYDETGLFAYAATIYPVMTAGIPAQQTSGVSLLSFRIGGVFSPIVKIPVDKSILPEQTQLPKTLAEELQESIDALIIGDPFDEDGTYPNLRAQATTKGDLGLGNVENYGIATQIEAQAGAVNNKYMTPLRTKEAILALTPEAIDLTAINAHLADNDIHFEQSAISITESQISDLGDYEPANSNIQTHISSTNNPHTVTKTQVGLPNVENYGIASKAEAEAGTANDKYMTPLRTKEAILELSPSVDFTVLDNHIADTTIHFTQAQISITENQISDFGTYEPAFTKNTGFNKNFGTSAGTVSEGNHTHNKSQITDFAHTHPITDISGLETELNSKATQDDIDVAIAALVDSSPEALNTLNELAEALANDPNFATTITNELAGKSDLDHTHLKADITDFAHTHVKADITDFAHTHVEADITDLDKYTQQEVDDLLDDKSDVGHTHVKADITDFAHNHDDLYYTETELNNGQLDNRYYTETEVNEFLDLNYRKQLYPNTKNTSGSTILKGAVVQFAGSQGDFTLIKNAVPAEVIANPEALMGLAENDILNDEFGNVVWFGNVINIIIDPALFQNGDILYFDNATGGLTKTAPAENKIIVAAVEKVSSNAQTPNGILLVRPKWVSRDIDDIDGLQSELNAINNTIGDIETILDSILGV